MLAEIGVTAKPVKLPADLLGISGLIIPGGESTVIDKLAKINGVFEIIREAIGKGMPVFGTCAGLIMLANKIQDGIKGQETFGGLNVVVQRNAFGSQVDSFETELDFAGEPTKAAFIRAPIVREVGQNVEILSQLTDGTVVAVQQKNLLGISFHPEIIGETRVHKYFVDLCKKAGFVFSN
jgi:5'-phosphate synthase pdxT subunit